MEIELVEKLLWELQNIYIQPKDIENKYFQLIKEAKNNLIYYLNTNNIIVKKFHNISIYCNFLESSIFVLDITLQDKYKKFFNSDYLDLWCLKIYLSFLYKEPVVAKGWIVKFNHILFNIAQETLNDSYSLSLDTYQKWLDSFEEYILWVEKTKYNTEKVKKGICTAICNVAGYGQIKSSDKDVVECELDYNHAGLHTGIISRYYSDPIFSKQNIKITWEIDEHIISLE